ncbi:MAG: hypothetical protein A2731_00730 [Candidatus Buchananbacteria bacterium RIFCSPHIGHO2_01_FULL_39_8]|nr:MAG: hypothetical protein A2731_00730 [Candidatus Buchananbacteria bacterium RIFCSPHIGHO2_01_FULL_39_8]
MTDFDINNFIERLNAKNKFDGNLVFGAKRFHQETNRTGTGKPSSGGFTKDLARSIEDTGKERYQRKVGMWEEVEGCPVCHSNEREFLFSRYTLDIYRCKKCTHGYLNPRVIYNRAIELYIDDQNSFNIYSSPLQIKLDEIKCRYALDLIKQLDPPGEDKIMDLGCGAGVMLKVAYKNSWKHCVGVDTNKKYDDIYRESEGVQFIRSTFESMDVSRLGNDYDCITMWEILEHIYDLYGIIKVVKGLLKKRGLLFIWAPNFLSLATRLMREMSPTFSWKHVSYFTPDSLKYLMKQNGLECVFMETVITEIDNIKSYMSGEYPYYGYGDPKHLFDFITPEYLYRNNLGSRIIGVFRNF